MSLAYLIQAHAEQAAALKSRASPRAVFVVKRGGNYEVALRWPFRPPGAALVALYQDGLKVAIQGG